MALIKSVSGMRGTIGGKPGDGLTPVDIVGFAAAYGRLLHRKHQSPVVVVGRDGRITGTHVQNLVCETLKAAGIHVIDLGLSTTPTVEMYVTKSGAQGGIIITASHNPKHWNALKFLNARGEFISAEEGLELLDLATGLEFEFVSLENMGTVQSPGDAIAYHVEEICKLDLVDVGAVRSKGFHVIADCVNSTGALAIPALLDALGCSYQLLNSEISGDFAHDPEPLPNNLTELMSAVAAGKADLGIAVDPDVDRLALVCEDGSYFGEEYTLVAVADYVLGNTPGNTVSNLSSSLALRDVTRAHGCQHFSSAVGEVHVVSKMKAKDAVIGGEGNGGIIYPPLHYGRDALAGIALLLTHLAKSGKTMSGIRSGYPDYYMNKSKLDLAGGLDFEAIKSLCQEHFKGAAFDFQDGIKVILGNEWVHLRKSNTEPIVRIYAESDSEAGALNLISRIKSLIPE